MEHRFWIEGIRRRARLRLRDSFFVIGRGELFPVFGDDPSISREHAVVVDTGEGLELKDLGARNGTYLNGRKLQAYARAKLQPGDELVIGSTRVRILLEGEEEPDEGDERQIDTADVNETSHTGTLTAEQLAALEKTYVLEDDEEEESQLVAPVRRRDELVLDVDGVGLDRDADTDIGDVVFDDPSEKTEPDLEPPPELIEEIEEVDDEELDEELEGVADLELEDDEDEGVEVLTAGLDDSNDLGTETDDAIPLPSGVGLVEREEGPGEDPVAADARRELPASEPRAPAEPDEIDRELEALE